MSANARADCPTPTYDPGSGRTEVAVAPGTQSTIAANGDSKFVLAWQTPDVGHVEIRAVRLDRAAIAAAMDQWWAGFDYRGLKAWKIAYEIKQKFAELGFDLRTTIAEGGTQP